MSVKHRRSAPLSPPPKHSGYSGLVEPFTARVSAQERALVAAGIAPAAGLTSFGTAWIDARSSQDLAKFESLLTPGVVFKDSATFAESRVGRDRLVEAWRAVYAAFPDLAFYPQGPELRALPYWDFRDGVRRATFPWRAVGRFSNGLQPPSGGPSIAPTNRNLDIVGVDRYVFDETWTITQVDSDWDILGAANQLGLLPLPALDGPLARAVLKVRSTVSRSRGRTAEAV